MTAGQPHDSTQPYALLEGFDFEQLIADCGYAAEDFIEYLLERGIKAVIPPHQQAKVLREYGSLALSRSSFGGVFYEQNSAFSPCLFSF